MTGWHWAEVVLVALSVVLALTWGAGMELVIRDANDVAGGDYE